MREMFSLIKQNIETGNDVILVSIIGDFGSAPRGAGAHMLVNHSGRIYGTIGGGAVEYQSEKLAAEALQEGRSLIKAFSLDQNQVEDIGMICGGNVLVIFQYISANDDQGVEEICDEALAMLDKNEDAWMVCELLDDDSWKMGLYSESAGLIGIDADVDGIREHLRTNSVRFNFRDKKYYSEPIHQGGRVLVFGGGHVAQELVPVLAHVGFSCVVIDDRPEFTRPELFPGAKDVIMQGFEDIDSYLNINRRDYIVIMTRGHAHDYTVLRQSLLVDTTYVGCIGSRAKISGTTQRLLNDGIPQEKIDHIHWPIGLAIKAETPAEIAISIAGELIMVRAELAGQKPQWNHAWLG